jgi:hypothetical protein
MATPSYPVEVPADAPPHRGQPDAAERADPGGVGALRLALLAS